MKDLARVNAEQRNGNLHIKLHGRFTPDVAAQLTMVMIKIYQGKGNIFIHTDMVTAIAPNSRYAFANLLKTSDLPRNNIYLTGKSGLDICCASLKFITRKEKKQGGCGEYGDCKCSRKKVA